MSQDLSVYDIYAGYFWNHINSGLENTSSLREVLDTYHGEQLVRLLCLGEEEVVKHFPWLSVRTTGLLRECTQNLQRQWLEMASTWDASDHYDRYGVWEGAAAGIFSEETGIGAAIGTALLPGIGTVIGSAIGGMIAGNRIDQDAQKHLELLDNQFQTMIQSMENFFNAHVVPSITADLNALDQTQIEQGSFRGENLQTDFVADALGTAVIGLILCIIHWGILWFNGLDDSYQVGTFSEMLGVVEPLWVYVVTGLFVLIGLATEVQKGLPLVTELVSVVIAGICLHVTVVFVNILALGLLL